MRKSRVVLCVFALGVCLSMECGATALAQGSEYINSADIDGILGGSGSDEDSTNGYDNSDLESRGSENAREASDAFKNMSESQMNDDTIREADRITSPIQKIVGYVLSLMGIGYFLIQFVISIIDLFALVVPPIRPRLVGGDGKRQLCSDTAYSILDENGYISNISTDTKTVGTGSISTKQTEQNQVNQPSSKKANIFNYLFRRGLFIVSATIVIFLVINNVFMKLGFFLVEKASEILGF